MPFSTSAPLASLIPRRQAEATAHAIAGAVGLGLWAAIRQNTPIYKGWDTGGLSAAEIGLTRGGREPGTLRKSIYKDPVIHIGADFVVRVATDDPIAPYVEWDTVPHMIYPRNASALRFMVGNSTIFAAAVSHPGTHGQHMFSIGAAITQAEIAALAAPALAAWEVGDMASLAAGEAEGEASMAQELVAV